MRLNKTLKNAAIALPLLALAACSSNDSANDQSSVESNAEIAAQQKAAEEKAAIAKAAKRAEEIKEKKRQELAKLRSEHIVYFDFDVSTVNDEYASILDAHAKFLSANANVKVVVEGHADERGTPEYNIALGERRAKAVATYLENMGVSADQLSVVSYGEEKPMVTDRTEAAFAKNRRAVIVY